MNPKLKRPRPVRCTDWLGALVVIGYAVREAICIVRKNASDRLKDIPPCDETDIAEKVARKAILCGHEGISRHSLRVLTERIHKELEAAVGRAKCRASKNSGKRRQCASTGEQLRGKVRLRPEAPGYSLSQLLNPQH
jgi:hypothetical protein